MNAVLPQIGFGFVAGFVAGAALRFLGRLAAITIGLGFLLLQTLAYLGYVQVDWYRIKQDVSPVLEQGALRSAWDQLVAVLTNNAPFGGGFVTGLLLGLRGRGL